MLDLLSRRPWTVAWVLWITYVVIVIQVVERTR